MANEERMLSLLETLTTDMSQVKQDLAQVKQEVSSLNQEVSELKTRVTKLEESVSDTRDILARIEIDHGRNIHGLHDGYKLLYESTLDIRCKLDRLFATQDDHDTHLKFLHSRYRSII